MAFYEFLCPKGHSISITHEMGSAPARLLCEVHNLLAERDYSSVHFQEDRRRFRGEGISRTTGLPYAQSRKEEKVIEKVKDIEFMGRNDMPDQWKRLAEHSRAVKSGELKKPLSPEELNPRPKLKRGAILDKMKEKGIRLDRVYDPTPMPRPQDVEGGSE